MRGAGVLTAAARGACRLPVSLRITKDGLHAATRHLLAP